MKLGLIFAVCAGLTAMGAGIVSSNAAKKSLNLGLIQGVASVFLAILTFALAGGKILWTGSGHEIWINFFVFLAGAGNFIVFLLLERAMRYGHNGLIWSIVNSALIFPFLMGIVIFAKAFSKKERPAKKIGFGVYPLALIGGFSDSLGGGGWGPVVTSTLVASDCDIRKTIGSVNAAEFFVTLSESITFFLTIGSLGNVFPAVIGLIAGGVLASPIAAYLCKKLPIKPLMMTVGILIVIVNLIKLLGR